MDDNLIEVQNLKVYFRERQKTIVTLGPNYLKAVDDVSFTIKKGETFGLVGESGSGKSTVGKGILRYHDLFGGKIFYENSEIGHLKEKELLPYRKKMQSIFQDPYSSLDPSKTISEIVREPMEIHNLYSVSERKSRAADFIDMVGLKKEDLLKYPHEFSGGQRQRIAIARALSIHPEFILCDEPISSLDVSLQVQIIQLLKKLQDKFFLTYLFISHQLQVVQKICDNIGVMYLGKILEISSSEDLFKNPLHPYTKMLMSSILEPDPRIKSLDNIVFDSDEQTRLINGCKFNRRCQHATEKCRETSPELQEMVPGHFVACFLYHE